MFVVVAFIRTRWKPLPPLPPLSPLSQLLPLVPVKNTKGGRTMDEKQMDAGRQIRWEELRAAADEVNIFHPMDADKLREGRPGHGEEKHEETGR